MKYIVRTILSLTTAAIMLSSCVKEKLGDSGGGHFVEGLPVQISLASRAMINIDDDDLAYLDYEVTKLRVIGFETKTRKLAFNRVVNPTSDGSNASGAGNANKDVVWKAEVEILTGDFTIVFIGNEDISQDVSDLLSDDDNIPSLSALESIFFAHHDFAWDQRIPMLSIYDNVKVLGHNHINAPDPEDATKRKDYTDTWRVGLDRMGVRLDLTLYLNTEQAANWELAAKDIKAYQISVNGVPLKVSLLPEIDNHTGTDIQHYTAGWGWAGYPDLSGTIEADSPRNYTLTFPRIIIPELWFEDKSNPDNAATIQIDLKSGTTTTTYTGKIGYDIINVDPAKLDYTLPRNHYFTINASVNSTSPEETLDLNLSVIDWDQKLLNGDINGPYELWVEETKLNLDWRGGETSLAVTCGYPEWTATLSTSADPEAAAGKPDWISPGNGWTNGQTFTVDSYNLPLERDYNFGSVEQSAYLHISAGRLKKVIEITQENIDPVTQPSSNCYMVDPNNIIPIGIPVRSHISKAITGIPNQVNEPGAAAKLPDNWLDLTGTKWSAAVLWSDREIITNSSVVNDVAIKGNRTSDISSSNDMEVVVVPGNIEGNTVVILFDDQNGDGIYDPDGGDRIVWSWHIWSTPYQPDETISKPTSISQNGPVKVTGGVVYRHKAQMRQNVFMDRNLGATNLGLKGDNQIDESINTVGTYGLHYQWGRKDPFANTVDGIISTIFYPANSATILTTNAIPSDTPNNLQNSVTNPLNYYLSTNQYHDWYTTTNDRNSQNGNLWGSKDEYSDIGKTVFDPCPPGWRVPVSGMVVGNYTYSAWSYYNGTDYVTSYDPTGYTSYVFDNGFYFNDSKPNYNIGWYPAAGGRLGNTGAFIGAGGTAGYYWSATVLGTGNTQNVSYLYFLNSLFNPSHNVYRSSGLSVRCVAE